MMQEKIKTRMGPQFALVWHFGHQFECQAFGQGIKTPPLPPSSALQKESLFPKHFVNPSLLGSLCSCEQ